MAKWSFKGLEEYVSKLERLQTDESHVRNAIKKGAGIVADSIRKEINALPVKTQYTPEGEKSRGITSVQKRGLQDSFGIAKMRRDGTFYNVKLGFDGYNGQKTHAYPNGQPNSLIARSIISGTSFRQKNDFIRRATYGKKAVAEKAMQEELDKSLKQLMR